MNPNATEAIDRACEGLARDLRTPPAILRALTEIERIIADERDAADDRRRLRRARLLNALIVMHTSPPEDPEPFDEFTGPMP